MQLIRNTNLGEDTALTWPDSYCNVASSIDSAITTLFSIWASEAIAFSYFSYINKNTEKLRGKRKSLHYAYIKKLQIKNGETWRTFTAYLWASASCSAAIRASSVTFCSCSTRISNCPTRAYSYELRNTCGLRVSPSGEKQKSNSWKPEA